MTTLDRTTKNLKSTLPISVRSMIVRCVCGHVTEVNAPVVCPVCKFTLHIKWMVGNSFYPSAVAPQGFTNAGIKSLPYPAPAFVDWVFFEDVPL